MSNWAATLGFSIICAVSAVSFAPGVAVAEDATPSPMRRPVLPTDPVVNSGEVVPLPNYAYPGTQDFNGVTVLTEEQIREGAAKEAAVWEKMAAKAKAEETAAKADVTALTNKQSADAREREAGDAQLRANIAKSNVGVAIGMTSAADGAASALLKTFDAKSIVSERAKLSGLNVAALSAKMQEWQYVYVSADLDYKSQLARVTADQAWQTFQRSNKAAVEARIAADKFREDYNNQQEASKLKAAADAVTTAETAYTISSKKVKALKDAIKAASDGYYAAKASLDAATALDAKILAAIKKHTKALEDVAAADGRATTLNDAATAAAKTAQLLKLPQATAVQLADARSAIAAARAAAGAEQVASIPIRNDELAARRAAEALVAPLTPNLTEGLSAELESYAGLVAEKTSVSTEYANTNSALKKTAAARAALVKSTAKAEATARGKLTDAETKLSQAEGAEKEAQAAVDALRPMKSTRVEIATARSNLAAAKAQVAAARSALSAVKLEIATAALTAALAIADTERDVLIVYPVQPSIDLNTLSSTKSSAAETDATDREAAGKATTLSNTAAARTSLINKNAKAYSESSTRFTNLTTDAATASGKVAGVVADVKKKMSEDPTPLTLANGRLELAKVLEEEAKANFALASEAVVKATAQTDLAKAVSESEPGVTALSKVAPVDDTSGAKTVLEKANGALGPAKGRSELATRLREAAQVAANDVAELDKKLLAANERLTGTAKTLKDATQAIQDELAKVQSVVDEGGNAKEVAEAMVEVDKDRAREAAAAADHADSEAKVSRATQKMRNYMVLTPADVMSLFPYAKIDLLAPSDSALLAAIEHYKKLAALVPIAEERVTKSRLAVEDIAGKMQISEDADKAASTATKASEEAKAALDTQMTEREGIVASVATKLAGIAARALPSVFSDSRISTYQETAKVQAAAIKVKDLEIAAANVEQLGADLDVAKLDLEYSRKALVAAQTTLAAAQAKYALQWSKRAGLTYQELGEAALAADLAEESLTAARSQIRKSFTRLLTVANARAAALETTVAAYAAVPDASKKKAATAAANLEKAKTFALEVKGEEDKAIAEERAQRLKQADALAEHSEALANGQVNHKIALESLVTKKMEELKGYDCKNKKQTDSLTCMVCNAQWEAGVLEPKFIGKLVPNRVATTRLYLEGHPYGESMCEVIYDPGQFSWTSFNDASTNNNYILTADEDQREEFTAAFVAYYEKNLTYAYEMYYSPDSMVDKHGKLLRDKNGNPLKPSWWDQCKDTEVFSKSTVCRIRPAIDLTQVHEDASLRVYKDNVDYESISEYLD